MSVYFIAQIAIHDEKEYGKYLEACGRVFEKFNGEYLAVDRNPRVLEGHWAYDRLVIIRFAREEDLKKWYFSSEYQEIRKFRLAGARCDTLLVKGKEEN